MNNRLATALSVAGVLVAGYVAAVANARVLADRHARDPGGVLATLPAAATTRSAATTTSSSPTSPSEQRPDATMSSATSGTVTPGGQSPGTVLSSPSVTTAPDDQRPVTTLPSSTPTQAATTVTAPTRHTYRMAEAGILVLDVTATTVEIHSLSPASGWHVLSADDTSRTGVRVVLASAVDQVTFDAVLVNGVLTDDLSRRSSGAGNSTSTTARPPAATTTERHRDDDRTTTTARRAGGSSTTEPPGDDGHGRGNDD